MTNKILNLNIDSINKNVSIILDSSNSYINENLDDIKIPSKILDSIITISLDPSLAIFEASLNKFIDNSSNDTITHNLLSINQLTIDVCSNVISNVVGSYNVIYNVSDKHGYEASAVRIVNVVDTTPPTITISGDNPLSFNINDTYIEKEAYAFDIVDGSLSFSQFDVSLTDLCMNLAGTYNVIYSISDACGNDASAIRVVNVVDNNQQAIITINLDPSLVILEASLNNFIDNSANDTISHNLFNFNQLTIDVCSNVISNVVGNYSVVINVTDPSGNDASAVRIVNVIDTTPPTITISGDNPLSFNINDTYIEKEAYAFDIVDGSLSFSQFDVSLTDLCMNLAGSYNVIYSISDACGNDASAIRVVNVDPPQEYIILNPELINYEIPAFYQSTTSIVFPQPGNDYTAYCVPTSFANVINYYSDSTKLNKAIQLNYTSTNSYPPLSDYLYNFTSRPNITGISDENKIDIGYILNTNDTGQTASGGSYVGTRIQDFPKFVDFLRLISPNLIFRFYTKGLNNSVSYAYTNVSGETATSTTYSSISEVISDIKEYIYLDIPLVASFNHYNISHDTTVGANGVITISNKDIYVYSFGSYVSGTAEAQSSNPIYDNPEHMTEVWSDSLGHTVNIVGYFTINSTFYAIVHDNINDYTRSSTDPLKTPKYTAIPIEENTFTMLTILDLRADDKTTVTNLECLAYNNSVNIVNHNGANKYVFNGGSSYDNTKKYGLYDGTYTLTGIPIEHPIAFLNYGKTSQFSYTGTNSIIEIIVSGGSFSSPYYSFNPNINDGNFNFIPGFTYRFKGGNISSSHPFYISDVGRNNQSTELTFTGSGSYNSGIYNNQSFDMTIPYNFSKTALVYYCTAHSSMQLTISSIISTQVNGNYYNFFTGDVTITINGDFQNMSAYCLYHGHMGAQNIFKYTTICNPNSNYRIDSDVKPLASGYLGTIRLYDTNDTALDYAITDINNSITIDPNKKISLFINDNAIFIKLIDPALMNYKIGAIMLYLYDELNVFVDATVSPDKINLTISNYVFFGGNTYYYIAHDGGDPITMQSITNIELQIGHIM